MQINLVGLDRAKSRLKAYKNGLADRRKKFMERLAEIGIDVADLAYRTAQYDGENDVVVAKAPVWVGNDKLVISASGSAITFIEFGSGVHYTETHPKASEFGYERGGYGQGKGSNDSWTYYGDPGTNGRVIREGDKGTVVRTHGNPPARAMYDAGKEMRERILEAAKEVWNNG